MLIYIEGEDVVFTQKRKHILFVKEVLLMSANAITKFFGLPTVERNTVSLRDILPLSIERDSRGNITQLFKPAIKVTDTKDGKKRGKEKNR